MRKPTAKPKKKQVAKKAQTQTAKTQSQTQTAKPQSQTQRQIVNVILPARTSQRVRQPKAQPQASQYQTFYIERSPSQQVISTDPFKTGVIQQNKEANAPKSGGLTTNVEGLSKLVPETAKQDFTKQKPRIQIETDIQTQSSYLQPNPTGRPVLSERSRLSGQTIQPSKDLELGPIDPFDPFNRKK